MIWNVESVWKTVSEAEGTWLMPTFNSELKGMQY